MKFRSLGVALLHEDGQTWWS